MNQTLHIANKTLTLLRYPEWTQTKSLQAWGAEDEHVINHISESDRRPECLLILNDDFGALGCGLADFQPQWYSDSYVSHCAYQANARRNHLDNLSAPIDSLTPLSGNFDTVILKLPKQRQYLIHQLKLLQQHTHAGSLIIATGKVKAVTRQVLETFERYLGPTKTSLAVKKSRLIFCTPRGEHDKRTCETSNTWALPATQHHPALTLSHLANVFSSQSLDIGARFMIENLPATDNKRIIDLGCGNGVLGIIALTQSPDSHVTFVDESFMAVESARQNVATNLPEKLEQSSFVVDNCLEHYQGSQVDLVLCNPPFHQQNTITDHIAWQMFKDAKRHLRPGGMLCVVGNRHLGYHDKLKRLFGGVKVLASAPKFVILGAIKTTGDKRSHA